MSFSSFNSYMYKKGCIKCLVDRIYKINNTWKGFDFGIKEMPHTLQKNSFPSRMIDKIIKEYLDNNIDGKKKTQTKKRDEIRDFKLPTCWNVFNTPNLVARYRIIYYFNNHQGYIFRDM